MAELKTKPRKASVAAFLKTVSAERRADCEALVAMMKQATRADPMMWGPSIIGFGDHHYVYESGRESDWFEIGFSPRKSDLTLYLMGGLGIHEGALAKLGKHKRGGGCLYLKQLADVDQAVLKSMMKTAVANLKSKRR
jgi:Domain of unknown function (DU1801)